MKNKIDKFFEIAEILFLATMLVVIPVLTGRNTTSGSASELVAMTVLSMAEIPILYVLIKNTIEKERKNLTDQEKTIQLLKELGIKYEINGDTLYLDNTECDGAQEFGISFWDGEDYPKGKFHEFWVVPEERRNQNDA